MKILVISTKLPYPPRDGGAIATLNLATGLSAAGNDITLLCFNTSKHYFNPDHLPSEITKQIKVIAVSKDTRIKPVNAVLNFLFSRKAYISSRYHSKKFKRTLKQQLHGVAFDIIQLEGPYLDFYIKQIRRSSAAKIVMRAHNIEHEIWERRAANEERLPIKLYLKNLAKRIARLEENLLHKIDALVPISERDESRFKATNKNLPMLTIPGGLELKSYHAKELSDAKTIFFLGALDWAPNTEALSWFIKQVWPLVNKSDPGIEMHVAGRNPSAKTRTLFADNQIHFHGEVEDARAFMTSYNIMVLPLHTGSGIRIKLLEAMALGRAIISTKIGAEGLDVKNGKHLIIEDKPEAFAEKICQLASSQSKTQIMGHEGVRFVRENFDTFAIASKLSEFYSKLA